ncbi:MAG: hypothetical protein CML55_01725 [Rhodobacteraceae bacterium]|nr:hypothetical protein [Paracoccaceae bacterium]
MMAGTGSLPAVWWLWIILALLFGVLALRVPKTFFLGCALAALVMTIVTYVLPGSGLLAMLAVFGGLVLMFWSGLRLALRSRRGGARPARRDGGEN